MAWTAPRTWVTAEIVTAGNMNTHVRDNFLETGPAKVTTAGDIVYAIGANAFARLGLGAFAANTQNQKYVTKSADESVTSSTTLQDDDDLLLAVGTNEIWVVELVLIVKSNAAADFKWAWTDPASATSIRWTIYRNTSGTLVADFGDATASALAVSMASATVPYPVPMHEIVVIETAGTSGNLQLQWAQNTSDGTATQVLKGSHLRALQIT